MDFGELLAEVPILLSSNHPAMVRYRDTMRGIKVDEQLRETLDGE